MSAGIPAKGGGPRCEDLLRGAVGQPRRVFSVERAPVTHVARLAGLFSSSFTWEPSEGPSFAGLGEAGSVELDPRARPSKVVERASALLSGLSPAGESGSLPRPRVCGGWAFDLGRPLGEEWSELGPGRLVLPRWLYQVGPADSAFLCLTLSGEEGARERTELREQAEFLRRLLAKAAQAHPRAPEMRAGEDDRERWTASVAEIGRELATGRLGKVVLSRRRLLSANERIEPAAVLRRLAGSSPRGTRFSITRGRTTFLGASPELLVRRDGVTIRSEAVAGSSRREESLLTSKNLAEHAHTVDGIQAALAPLCEALEHPTQPRVLRLRHVMHLVTPFTGRLAREEHILGVVERLHPTPAVCGVPRPVALERIRRLEPFSRGWYAGPVGHFDADGDGEFRVALRSAVIAGRRATLYAGAGLVNGSTAEDEWRETEIKLGPMLAALGAAPE